MNGFLWIDGRLMPTPNRCPITVYDLDASESGRAENGVMHRKRTRAGLISMEAAWEHLTAAEAAVIHSALRPAAVQVSFRFCGGTQTRRMYAGDRRWEPDFHKRGEEERWNLTVSLIEY